MKRRRRIKINKIKFWDAFHAYHEAFKAAKKDTLFMDTESLCNYSFFDDQIGVLYDDKTNSMDSDDYSYIIVNESKLLLAKLKYGL